MTAHPSEPDREQGPLAPCDAWRVVNAIVKPDWWLMAPPESRCTEIRVTGPDAVEARFLVPTILVGQMARALGRLGCVVAT